MSTPKLSVELDIEYKELAMKKNGCELYLRAPALGKNEEFIKSLFKLVTQKKNAKIINALKYVAMTIKNVFIILLGKN